ncbi:MAG: histidine phosphatase family protein [Victivallales bacterium]|nr:histidine phosphatase family protein [Victivallales bacterium]
MILTIVRHGQTDYNIIRRIQGQSNSQLTDLGKHQARLLAKRLEHTAFNAFYTSDLDRAMDTAGTIHPIDDFILDKRLRERAFGRWQGLNYMEIKKEFPELISRYESYDPSFAPPGGESWNQMRERAKSFIDDMAARHANDDAVLAVSHGGLIKAIMAVVCDPELKLPGLPTPTGPVDNTAITKFTLLNGKWRLNVWNDTAHLESFKTN